MRRIKKAPPAPPPATWLITFSDLVTLLLTFFVLLLSMTVVDKTLVNKMSSYFEKGQAGKKDTSQDTVERILEFYSILEEKNAALSHQILLKSLLFPKDLLPNESVHAHLQGHLAILQKDEGIALVLGDALFFSPGMYRLTEEAKTLLDLLVPVIVAGEGSVNLAAYTDPSEAQGSAAYDLAVNRSLSILAYFLQTGIKGNKFSISAYGNKAVEQEVLDSAPNIRGRVEILLKSTAEE